MTSSIVRDYSVYSLYRLRQRELGFQTPIGSGDAFAKSLYSNLAPIGRYDFQSNGGIFNMEFSPEGSVMVAACEKKSVLIFDPLTHKKIRTLEDAHEECVNCVKFLDSRTFATCSDDHKIALWDIRNPVKKIRTLLGHSSWVKNIEYSPKDKLLITLGLEGSIFTWDISSYTEASVLYHCVFHSMGLMRCRLSPDASKMVMCTTGGLIMIVHDLNLSTLAHDLVGFKPNTYRLMQMSKQHIPIAAAYDHLFDRKQNRVEFISDFPENNDAEVVSSLQIHPQGWCALSRNISHDEKSEWTCVHDIQEKPKKDDDDQDLEPSPPKIRRSLRRSRGVTAERRRPLAEGPTPGRMSTRSSRNEARPATPPPPTEQQAPRHGPDPNPAAGIQNDVWEASISISQYRHIQEMTSRGQAGRSFHMQRIAGINTGIAPPHNPALDPSTPVTPVPSSRAGRLRLSTFSGRSSATPIPIDNTNSKYKIRLNDPRLLFYVKEANEGTGFIKELCFSTDGRLICSPFGYGVRLFAMNENCSELSHCVNDGALPRSLVQVGQITRHHDMVVSAKFSPTHPLMVTGSLEGRIVWYQPIV